MPVHIGKSEVEKIPLGQGGWLYHIGDRFFVKDRQQPWRELAPDERKDIPRQLFFGEERQTLAAYDLVFSKKIWERAFVRQERVFCDHISFRAEPGTLTGIIGPSGAGKTVLLNLLSGYTYSTQNKGRAFILDKFDVPKFDVHQDRRYLGGAIGYVPQDDTLIPQLTVHESLDSCFRLRYAGVEKTLRIYIVNDACRKVGFAGTQLQRLLKTRIGSPEAKTLSGGERKRVNIAHELIRNPLMLFLDEPTSGLSSVDADMVVQSLRNLCDTTNITIVLTIHQPSDKSFHLLDKLLVVNKGGNMAFLGDAADGVAYFQHQPGMPYSRHPADQRQNPAEYILEALDQWEKTLKTSSVGDEESVRRQISAIYNQSPHYFPFEITETTLVRCASNGIPDRLIKKLSLLKQQEWFWRNDFLDALKHSLGIDYTDQVGLTILSAVIQTAARQDVSQIPYEKPHDSPRVRTSFLHQFGILVQRNLSIANADRNNRLFQLVQPVAIGLLMLLAFTWYAQDYYGEDILARIGYEFTQQWGQKTIIPGQDLPVAKSRAYQEQGLLGEGSARLRASVFFLLIASCLWFGIINACREIVDERTVLKREAKSTLRISSYLAAKIVSLAWTCLQQVALLVAIVALPNLLLAAKFIPAGIKEALRATPVITRIDMIGVFLILWLTSILASWTGLLISALAPTQRFALTAVPLVIIPQLLFGGLIRPIKDIDNARSFMMTADTLVRLKNEGLSEELVTGLAAIQDQRFTKEHDFWFAVETVSGKKPGTHLKEIVLRHADMPKKWACVSFPGHIHDIMLQKWAFQIILLYDSLGELNVLRKIVDVNRYDKYEYLQFEQVELVELFFDIFPDDAREELEDRQHEARMMLSRTVSRIILYHLVVLLIPTYIVIRKTTQA